MNVFYPLLRRRALFFAACSLLLALGVAFSAIGVSTYAATREQKALVDAEYTSIAIPNNERMAGWMPLGWYQKVFPQDGQAGLLETSPVKTRQDVRILLGAVVAGMQAATYETNDPLSDGYMIEMDAPYTMSVFAVRCDKVETGVVIANDYDYTLSVERAICYCGWGYPVPEKIGCNTLLANNDGTPLMEEGKTYLIRGNCIPHTADPDSAGIALFHLLDGKGDDGLQWDPDSGIEYLEEDVLPLCTPYAGDLDDFLASEAGALWREDIIPAVERVYSTAKLILTDNVYGIYQFNTGSATILEGRAISAEEYAQGANVCLVSQQYAKKNGLTVGDALSMDLYKPPISYAAESLLGDDGEPVLPPDQCTMWMNPCYPQNALDITKEYTIVGIYTGLSAYRFVFPFTPDMIYAPKASVPQAAEFEEEFGDYAFTVSLLLENGKLDAFDTYVKGEGCENWFLYFDQGYAEVSEALNETMASALRLLVASAVAFLVALCVYFFLLVNALGPVIWRMRIIGARAGTCWRQALWAAVPMLLLSVAVGAALGGVFFGTVSRAVLTQAAEYPLSVALLCALGQFVLLAVLAAVILLIAARRPLMRKRKPRR